jgi:D-alanyl-D-alanine-carboxypeptidase/D-alanyl-D-alanine-endopeptidase
VIKLPSYFVISSFFLLNLSSCVCVPEHRTKEVDYYLTQGLHLQTKESRQKLALRVLSHKPSDKTKSVLYDLKTNDEDCFERIINQTRAKKIDCHQVKVHGLGSFSKVFTTTLLAALVQDKLINLDDSIFPTLPYRVQRANPALKQITYRELALHEAGFPQYGPVPSRFYLAYATSHSLIGSNPYAYLNEHYAMNALMKLTLPKGNLRNNYEYSDFGIALLAYAMSHQLKKSYAYLFKHYLAKPLHLKNTYLTVNEVPDSKYTPGHAGSYVFYQSANAHVKKWDIPKFMVPSMGYYSDVNDVSMLVKSWQGRSHSSLDQATQVFSAKDKEKIFSKNAFFKLDNVNEKQITYHKNGVGAGYNNELYFTSSGPLFVVLLSNEFSDTDDIAFNLYALLIHTQIA